MRWALCKTFGYYQQPRQGGVNGTPGGHRENRKKAVKMLTKGAFDGETQMFKAF